MKDSVWYHKLWKKKLNELPVKEDVNTAWSNMQSLLDKNMPLNKPVKGNALAKTIGSKLVSMLGYILPAAAMVSTITYLTFKEPTIKKSLPQEQTKNFPEKRIKLPVDMGDSILNPNRLFSSSATSNNTGIKERNVLVRPYSIKVNASSNSSNERSHTNTAQMAFPTLSNLTSIDPENKNFRSLKTGDPGHNQQRINQQIAISNGLKVKTASKKKQKTFGTKEFEKDHEIITPQYNYGVEVGLNTYSSDNNIFVGAFGSYSLSKRTLINGGIRINIGKELSGEYTHPNYNLDFSPQPLTILDSRKLDLLDIPLSLEYKISNTISIKAGPVIRFLLNSRGIGSKLGPVANPRDTSHHSLQIHNALNKTHINKINTGFSGGLIIHIKQFSIEASYLQYANPFKVSSDLGFYRSDYRTFSVGVGYRFR